LDELSDSVKRPWRLWTIPNAVSVLRLLGIPIFLWVLLVARNDLIAFGLLAFAGATDWIDGYLARKLHQTSRFGEVLDPLADRLYIAATIIGLAVREFIPWWLVLLVASRDVLLIFTVPMLRKLGLTAFPVTYVGKSGTFALLWGFPLFLLSSFDGAWGSIFGGLAWAFSLWGVYLYWWAGIRYFGIGRSMLHYSTGPR
jgi:cardiolipin synthase (CMP-forming)